MFFCFINPDPPVQVLDCISDPFPLQDQQAIHKVLHAGPSSIPMSNIPKGQCPAGRHRAGCVPCHIPRVPSRIGSTPDLEYEC
jgi:hypothetical protein